MAIRHTGTRDPRTKVESLSRIGQLLDGCSSRKNERCDGADGIGQCVSRKLIFSFAELRASIGSTFCDKPWLGAGGSQIHSHTLFPWAPQSLDGLILRDGVPLVVFRV